MRPPYYIPLLFVTVLAFSSGTTYGHTPLKRLPDQNDMFYVSPRIYVGDLKYLPPQELKTKYKVGYGVYGSVLVPIKPVSPNLYGTVDADVLLGTNLSEAQPIATQLELGVRYKLPRNFSVGFKSSKHYINQAYHSDECAQWSAVLLGYDFSFPCRLAQVNNSLEFYFFPPHNEFDSNPGVRFRDRVVARYGLDYTVALEKINNSPVYLAASFFLPFGDSRPQNDYNYNADAIACFMRLRCGYRVNQRLSFFAEFADGYDLGGIVNSRELHESLSFGSVFAF
jgi:hypothetical protein